MNSTSTRQRDIKRKFLRNAAQALGLGLSALGLSFVTSPAVRANNATAPSATPLAPTEPSLLGVKLALFESITTKKFFDSQLGSYDAILNPWRYFATRHNLSLAPVSLDRIKTLAPGTILILPAMVALQDTERKEIEQAAARGVSLLATWAFAPREANGTWIGYEFMQKLFAAKIVGEVRPEQEERFLQPYAEGPITMNMPPLKRISLGKVAEPLLRAEARFGAARYSDWTRSVHKDSVNLAAASYWETPVSRRVWFGFAETTWFTAQADIDRLLLDSLVWLARRPAAALANWPAPYQGAFLVEMDTEDKFANALLFEEELTKRNLRGTFYCLTDQAVKHPEVVKKLAQRHEVAFHADIHTGFKGVPAEAQEARINKMFGQLSPLVPDAKQLTGFRAPLEEFDVTTETLLRKKGIRHHATSPDYADIALPSFSKSEPILSTEDALVLLPRTMLDDVNFFRMGMLEKSVAGVLQNSARKVADSRGFGLLSLHTQNYSSGSALQRDVPRLLDDLVALRNQVWIASGDQIERWWRERARLSAVITPVLAVKQSKVQELDVLLTVKSPGNVKNAQVVVTCPVNGQPPKLRGLAGVQLSKLDEHRFALLLPELRTGSYAIRLSF